MKALPTTLAILSVATGLCAMGFAGCAGESAASPVAAAERPSESGVAPAQAAAVEATASEPAAVEAASPGPTTSPPKPPLERTAAEGAAAPETEKQEEKPAARPSRPPPADRAPRKPGDAEKITFEDLILGMQADVVFRPFMLTDRAKELEGQRVSISGYMHGGVASTRANKEFILLRNTECKFGPGGQADHLAQVYLRKGATTEFTGKPIKVEGELVIEPFEGTDGNTWAIYQLQDAQIK